MKTTSFCVLFLFIIVSSLYEAQASSENKRFCNDWAVEITSGDEVMATRIASDNGFTNLGQVILLCRVSACMELVTMNLVCF